MAHWLNNFISTFIGVLLGLVALDLGHHLWRKRKKH